MCKTVGELREFLAKLDSDAPVAIVYLDEQINRRVEALDVTLVRRMVHDKGGWIENPRSVDEGVDTVLLFAKYAL